MDKVRCKKCGEDIYSTELVCPNCGMVLEGSAYELRLVQEKKMAEEEAANLRAELVKKEEEVRKLRENPPPVMPATAPPVQPTYVGCLIDLFCFLAPVLGILIAAMFLSQGTPSGQKTGENCLTFAVLGLIAWAFVLWGLPALGLSWTQ